MQTNRITLSYFMTTYNKLPYLRIVLEDLMKNRLPNEEIIIADGGSTDGTPEWLAQLFAENRIQGFVSEKDRGEAHGVNRAVLKCQGEVMKWINDDDIFHYPAIRECCDFLLNNPEYDIVGADGFDNYTGQDLELITHLNRFKKWQTEREPFGFYGPGLSIRRSSLPLLGLFNTLSRFVDNEYTFRITSLPIKMAWYTRPVFVRVINPESNTLKFLKAKKVEEGLNWVYRKIATGRPPGEVKRKEMVNRLKGRVYDLMHRRSSTIRDDKYVIKDINELYAKHKLTLEKSFQESDANNAFLK